MDTPVKLSDLILTLDIPSEEYRTYIDLKTGAAVSVEETMLLQVEEGEAEEEDLDGLPAWQKQEYEVAKEIAGDDGSRFILPPSKFEFHEYRVMEKFISSIDDDDAADQLWRAIKGRGAFRYF